MHRRVTITIDEEVLAHAEALVAAGQAKSLSALIAGAVEKEVKREKLADVMNDILAELGPPTEEDEAWVQEALELLSS
jgi:hypothetical protein